MTVMINRSTVTLNKSCHTRGGSFIRLEYKAGVHPEKPGACLILKMVGGGPCGRS